MNHIYLSIWNEAQGVWMGVSEIAKGQGKRSSIRRKLLISSLLLCTSSVWALPTGEQLVAGQAIVSVPIASLMQIQQSSQNAALNWQDFSIQQNEAVNIQQPNAQAALLNRVVGQDASQIQGKLNANGQVYLVNPNGVVFGKTAQVDVGGLIASTHNISNVDFMNGNRHFTQDGTTGTVENHGTIKVPEGGVVALIGESVTNTGIINTPKGTTALAAGKTVDLDFKGDGLVEVKVSEAALNAQINNSGAIQADGGRVVLTAKAAGQLIDTVINQDGIVRAQGLVERNGEIILEGGYVSQTGTLDTSGNTGGKIDINARAILDTGKINADGRAGNGGNINLVASDAIIQTAAADTHANGTTTGGTVHLEAANSMFSSGKLSATGEQGGVIDVVSANRVVLAAATIDASGNKTGGLIRVGGDFHGANAKLPNAKTTIINGATKIKANGGKGRVVVWSNEKTDYYGSISADLAGNIEVSSKGLLNYAGAANAGVGGHLLLDPKNIVISSTGGIASYELIDPHFAAGNQFGANIAILGSTVNGVFTENGSIVVTSPHDNFTATDAGVVHLFNTTTGALIATLTGSKPFDRVGSNGITVLSNGNYVVASPKWHNNLYYEVGAVTWGNGITGVSGVVSSDNSLVGTTARVVAVPTYRGYYYVYYGDTVGSGGVTALNNGNYVVASPEWNSGAGAATWGDGNVGIRGAVSGINSLTGGGRDFIGPRSAGGGDHLASGGVVALSDGNYIVNSPDYGGFVAGVNIGYVNNHVGAFTWGNGTTGTSGSVYNSNSLIGSVAPNYPLTMNPLQLVMNPQQLAYYYAALQSYFASRLPAEPYDFVNGASTVRLSNHNYIFSASNGNYIAPLNNGNYVQGNPFWGGSGLENAGKVSIVTPSNIYFNNALGRTMTFNPSTLTNTLASGTNVTLQASNDITLNTGTDIIVGGNNGGAFTLQAGRNITLNSSIRTANGDFTAIAGDPNAIATDREAGTPTITLGSGATIDAGIGKVILAAIDGNFVNNSGLVKPITASQWLIYSTDPSLDILNGMTSDNSHYDQPYTNSTPDYASTGNLFLYNNPIKTANQTIKSAINPVIYTHVNPISLVTPVDLTFRESQIVVPLQISTTFLHGYRENLAFDDDYIDNDFGQYKGDAYSLKTSSYESRRERYERGKNKNRDVDLLLSIENGGIKLPVGW